MVAWHQNSDTLGPTFTLPDRQFTHTHQRSTVASNNSQTLFHLEKHKIVKQLYVRGKRANWICIIEYYYYYLRWKEQKQTILISTLINLGKVFNQSPLRNIENNGTHFNRLRHSFTFLLVYWVSFHQLHYYDIETKPFLLFYYLLTRKHSQLQFSFQKTVTIAHSHLHSHIPSHSRRLLSHFHSRKPYFN